jgi:hypothetical protein
MIQSGIGQNDAVPLLFRSPDMGLTWLEQGPIWPDLRERYSLMVNISRASSGDLFLYGMRWPFARPGESFVHPTNHSFKQNDLVWARSGDDGRSWSQPQVIPMPVPGSAEAPGALLVTRSGRWLAPYAPYPTWDLDQDVDISRSLVVASDDGGQTWPEYTTMLRAIVPGTSCNEQWVTELSDGRLLGAAWHVDPKGASYYPNIYAISHDGGSTWQPTRSTELNGQSIATAALPDGRVAYVYNVRTGGEPGVWLAIARPTDEDFGVEANAIIWRAQTKTQHDSAGHLADGGWLDFAFGEPSVTALPDGTFLVCLWCIQPDGRGIRFVKVVLTN